MYPILYNISVAIMIFSGSLYVKSIKCIISGTTKNNMNVMIIQNGTKNLANTDFGYLDVFFPLIRLLNRSCRLLFLCKSLQKYNYNL